MMVILDRPAGAASPASVGKARAADRSPDDRRARTAPVVPLAITVGRDTRDTIGESTGSPMPPPPQHSPAPNSTGGLCRCEGASGRGGGRADPVGARRGL